jgi:hypothetical protein
MNRFICWVTVTAAVLTMPAASARAAGWVVGQQVDFLATCGSNASGQYGGYAVPIGGFNSLDSYDCFGLLRGEVKVGNPAYGLLGAQWPGPVEVSTLSLEMWDDANRKIPSTIYLYTSTDPRVAPIEIPYPLDRGLREIDLTVYNGGQPILAANSYLLVAVQTMHPNTGGDGNFGVKSYGFEAKAAGPANTDLNLDATVSGTGMYMGTGSIAFVNDGVLHTRVSYWVRDDAEDTLTMTYRSAQESIGSIGLGVTGDAHDRDAPMWVYVTATFSNGKTSTQRIDLRGEMLSYGRYELPDGPFYDVMSLTLTMPLGADDPDNEYFVKDNWWLFGDKNYGFTQFQAFAGPPIPEPLTLTLLAAGGLAVLRRRT